MWKLCAIETFMMILLSVDLQMLFALSPQKSKSSSGHNSTDSYLISIDDKFMKRFINLNV